MIKYLKNNKFKLNIFEAGFHLLFFGFYHNIKT